MIKTKITLLFVGISIALALQKDGISHRFNMPAPAYGGNDFSIAEDSEEREKRRAWLEKMHRAAPGTDWRQLEYENRITRIRKQRTELKTREDCGNTTTLANGWLQGRWLERGSNNQAGSIHDVAYDSIHDKIWLISAGGTLWRGERDGSDWQIVQQYLQFNAGLLRFVTQDDKKRLLAFSGRIPHFSDDLGVTWQAATGISYTDRWGDFSDPIVLNDEANTFYVLAKPDYWSNITLYKSTDKGVRFTPVRTFATSDFSNLKLSLPHHANAPLLLEKKSNDYVQISSLNPETNELTALNAGNEFRIERAPANLVGWISPDSVRFYAYTQQSGTYRVYRSVDYGRSWKLQGTLPATPWKVGLYISPSNPDALFMGEVECYRSWNGGKFWQKVNNWWEYYDNVAQKMHADMMYFAEFETTGGQTFQLISHHGGITYTEDFLETQQNISLTGLNTSQYYSVRTDPYDPAYVYAGSQDQGFQMSYAVDTDGTRAFEQLISGDYGHIVFSNAGLSLWAVYPGGDVIFYTDAQSGRRTTSYKLTSEHESVWLPPLMESPFSSENAIYMAGGNAEGGDGSFIIRLSPKNREIKATQLPFDFRAATGDGAVSAMATSPLDSTRWYAATTNGRFFYSNDAGRNWEQNINFVPDGHYLYGQAIYASKLERDRVYLGGSGYSNPPFYRSTDGGANFTAMSKGLPNTLILDLAANADESLIFAATEAGPYVLVVAEERWYDLAEQCAPAQTYWSVEFVEATNTVRFGTYGRGIWDLQLEETVDTDEPELVAPTVNVFPNPSNGIVNIEWNFDAQTQIRIWDVNGKLVQQMQPGAGSQVQLNLSHLARGAYFLQIAHAQQLATTKILLR